MPRNLLYQLDAVNPPRTRVVYDEVSARDSLSNLYQHNEEDVELGLAHLAIRDTYALRLQPLFEAYLSTKYPIIFCEHETKDQKCCCGLLSAKEEPFACLPRTNLKEVTLVYKTTSITYTFFLHCSCVTLLAKSPPCRQIKGHLRRHRQPQDPLSLRNSDEKHPRSFLHRLEFAYHHFVRRRLGYTPLTLSQSLNNLHLQS